MVTWSLKLRPDWLSEYCLAAILNKLASNKTCNFRPLTHHQFHLLYVAWKVRSTFLIYVWNLLSRILKIVKHHASKDQSNWQVSSKQLACSIKQMEISWWKGWWIEHKYPRKLEIFPLLTVLIQCTCKCTLTYMYIYKIIEPMTYYHGLQLTHYFWECRDFKIYTLFLRNIERRGTIDILVRFSADISLIAQLNKKWLLHFIFHCPPPPGSEYFWDCWSHRNGSPINQMPRWTRNVTEPF